MKDLPKYWSRLLLVVIWELVISIPSIGQIQLKCRKMEFRFFSIADATATINKNASEFFQKRFWIVKRTKPLSEAEVQIWKNKGVVVTYIHSPEILEISVPAGFSTADFELLHIDGISDISPIVKIDPILESKIFSATQSDKILVQVVANKGLKSSNINANWRSSWGDVEECWSGDFGKWIVRCTPAQIEALASCAWTRWIEPAEGEIIPLNQIAASNGRVRALGSSGFGWQNGLDGSGVSVAVGDGGMVERHADLEKNQENWTSSKLSSFADHQDHVTGTIGGQGFLQMDKRGMASGVRIVNLQTSSVISTGAQLSQQEGINLTSNSYGQTFECSRAGWYNATSAFIDEQISLNPTLLHVVASGNQGGSQCNDYPIGFQTIAEGYPVSKNGLTVGAVLGKDEFAWFSSSGPVADGRLKPEIVADGNEVFSTIPQDQYGAKGGTSMATPVVTGTLALLTQRFKQLNDNQIPEAALLKAIVCNSAEDIGRPNVDFTTGYGRLNGRRARNIIEGKSFLSGIAASGQQQIFNLNAPIGAVGVKVMLSWTDPSGLPGMGRALVHNLDLLVRRSSGSSYLPWVLDASPSLVNQSAFRGRDTLNNMEQVTMPVFGGESIQIEISAGTITSGGQKFWIVYQWDTPMISLTSPVQNEELISDKNFTFYWDLDALDPIQLTLQTSGDSLGEWSDWKVIPNPKKLSLDQILPNTAIQFSWFRLKAESPFGTLYSNVVGCKIGKTVIPQYQTCQNSLKVSWNSIPDATRYQILQLDPEKGNWSEIDATTTTQFIIGNLEEGRRTVISVRPWFGNMPGIRSSSKVWMPQGTGACDWNDLAVSGLETSTFFRLGTSLSGQTSIPIRVNLKNIGNEPIVRNSIPIKVRFSSGQISQSIHSVVIPVGESKTIDLPFSQNISVAGDYPIKIWLAGNVDENLQNDTLNQVIRVISNPAIVLPWKFDVNELPDRTFFQTYQGLEMAPNMDFTSVNEARLRTTSRKLPESFGPRSLVFDKKRLDGKTAESDLIFTLNLTGNVVENELFVDFDIFPFSSLSADNAIWIRANDQSPWIQVLSFSNPIFVPGQISEIRSLNLRPYLSSLILGSSFQLKLTYSGQKPGDIMNGQGYAIDNLLIYIPTRDVVIRSILSPSSGCAGPSKQRVKIRMFNEREVIASEVRIGYSFGSGEVFEQVIPAMDPGDSLDFEFSPILPANLVGKVNLKVWSIASGDHYSLNDTLRASSLFIAPVITGFPYHQGFEESNGFWQSTGAKSSWEWGTPSKSLTIIDTAANGAKLWATNLQGFYNANEQSYLQSPCFNVASIPGDIQFSFNSRFDTEPDYDNSWIEFSEDGNEWIKLGQKGLGTNWYNHDSQSWNGRQSRWQTVSYKLPKSVLNNLETVQFRLAFQSDVSNQREGIAFDDFHLEQSVEIAKPVSEAITISGQTRGKKWIQVGPGEGRIAEIEIDQQQNPISFSVFGNEGKIRTFGYSPYLDRNFKLQSGVENQVESRIRFYFTETELKKLEENQPSLRSFQNLAIFQYRGLNLDGNPENNAYSRGKSRFIPASTILKVPTSGGYYLEFLAVPDGEFYLTTESFDAGDLPLPVQLIQFTANRKILSKSVEIYWKTASERNCDYFDLDYSTDGKDYQKVGRVQSNGSENEGSEYRISHSGISTNGMIWYRLNQFDVQSQTPHSYFTFVHQEDQLKPALSFVNPIGNQLEWVGSMPANAEILISDALGKVLFRTTADQIEALFAPSLWPTGTYFVKVISDEGVLSQTLVKY